MAFDAFLQISNIPGESTDDKHKDWIEVLSFSYGVSHAVTGSLSSGGSQFSERANFDLFKITKSIDIATPKLFFFCAKGEPIPKMKFELCRATGEKTCYERIDFENCHVQAFLPSGAPDQNQALPLEEVAFTFSKATVEYFKTDHATAKLLGSGGKTFWDQTKNVGG
jgi:type VI secretion system secreted protein Hcp